MILSFSGSLMRDFVFIWGLGTIYMCAFALFVGMTRQYILRPGTLFFIRSPEDPNTRLVHDALMKPLPLQLWRISQSGIVYTLFILIGVGSVCHGLKAAGSSLLPLRLCFASGSISFMFLVWALAPNSGLLKKYIRQYWTRAFKACAAQTRLSSFLLGKHNPKERGRVVYRNLFARLKRTRPDFTQPVTATEVSVIFETTAVDAVFVPDGYYVRAPKFDIASRKFIRTLFVPVTKDDIPLTQPPQERPIEVPGLEDESDDDTANYNQYEIVYRPPFFVTRIMCLLVMLWVFALILICGTIFTSNIIGRPLSICADFILLPLDRTIQPNLQPLQLFSLQLDTNSILFGLLIILAVLHQYDAYIIKKHIGDNSGETAFNALIRGLKNAAVMSFNIMGFFLFGTFEALWTIMFMKAALVDPVNYIFGESMQGTGLSGLISCLMAHSAYPSDIMSDLHQALKTALEVGPVIAFEAVWASFTKRMVHKWLTTVIIGFVLQLHVAAYGYFVAGNYADFESAFVDICWERNHYEGVVILLLASPYWSNIITHLSTVLNQKYQNITQVVREEHYARGKTLENVQTDDLPETVDLPPATELAQPHDEILQE